MAARLGVPFIRHDLSEFPVEDVERGLVALLIDAADPPEMGSPDPGGGRAQDERLEEVAVAAEAAVDEDWGGGWARYAAFSAPPRSSLLISRLRIRRQMRAADPSSLDRAHRIASPGPALLSVRPARGGLASEGRAP